MINIYKFIFIIILSLYSNASFAGCVDENYSCVCNAGYYAVNQDTSTCSCSQCPTGTYKTSSSGETSCTSCPSGSTTSIIGAPAVSACTCSYGYYGDASSGSACTGCPTNATCAGGNSSTFVCNSGFYNTGSGCTACPSNSTCSGTSFYCNTGFYKDGAACIQCPSGSTSPASSTSVSACYCSVNYYGNASSGSACTGCPTNATCAGGNNSSFSCIAGYYNNGSSCINCATATGNLEATSAAGSTSITNCYLPTSYRETDETGEFGFPSNCQYAG